MSVEKAERLIKEEQVSRVEKPSREEAERAVQTLLRWAGDDPFRPGLINTPFGSRTVLSVFAIWPYF